MAQGVETVFVHNTRVSTYCGASYPYKCFETLRTYVTNMSTVVNDKFITNVRDVL